MHQTGSLCPLDEVRERVGWPAWLPRIYRIRTKRFIQYHLPFKPIGESPRDKSFRHTEFKLRDQKGLSRLRSTAGLLTYLMRVRPSTGAAITPAIHYQYPASTGWLFNRLDLPQAGSSTGWLPQSGQILAWHARHQIRQVRQNGPAPLAQSEARALRRCRTFGACAECETAQKWRFVAAATSDFGGDSWQHERAVTAFRNGPAWANDHTSVDTLYITCRAIIDCVCLFSPLTSWDAWLLVLFCQWHTTLSQESMVRKWVTLPVLSD